MVTPRWPRSRHPAQVVVAGFAAAVAAGTGLLMLPTAKAGPGGTGLLEALFTSTSAVCVTGLIVVDTPVYWTGFGQAVIPGLLQVGGSEPRRVVRGPTPHSALPHASEATPQPVPVIAWRQAGVLRVGGQVGEKAESYGSRVHLHPVYERSRPDMFHVLRHTFASVQLEAGDTIVSVATCWGTPPRRSRSTTTLTSCLAQASAGWPRWTHGSSDAGSKVPEKSLAPPKPPRNRRKRRSQGCTRRRPVVRGVQGAAVRRSPAAPAHGRRGAARPQDGVGVLPVRLRSCTREPRTLASRTAFAVRSRSRSPRGRLLARARLTYGTRTGPGVSPVSGGAASAGRPPCSRRAPRPGRSCPGPP